MDVTLCITAFVELAEFSEFIDSASKSGKIRINLFLFRDEKMVYDLCSSHF